MIRKHSSFAWPPAAFALALAGCGQESTTAALRALDSAGDVSVVCLTRGDDGSFSRGVDLSECPDYSVGEASPLQRRLHALVTQPATGEVALVDLSVETNRAVVDFEPSQPGFSFMPVGAEPTSIVSTPGGAASFVGVAEAGREGVFALPSSCVGPRPADEPVRDIRTWPACRLPAAPGPMLIVNDPAIDHDSDPSTPPRVRERCEADYVEPSELIGQAPAAGRERCPADLALEERPLGRRKLLVTLPSLGEIWVLDAQELVDREPGTYDACAAEARLALTVETDTVAQQVPPELVPADPSCSPVGYNHGPTPEAFRPWPSDLALDDEGRVYVADTGAPVIHVLDVNDPCAVAPLPSLRPLSYLDPTAVITTRRVAVSELTPLGQRFVYAVDGSETRTAGTLMAFDVSPGSADRTPIVRRRSQFTPNESPDRITLPGDVADVEFVTQDFPLPINEVAVEGIACDPHPSVPADDPSALYRPRAGLTAGARPTLLRGTFAFAALHSGQVSIVDVEDLDAACRRPASINVDPNENLFGCSNDDPTVLPLGAYVNETGPTVSNELSCNVVAPHRARGRSFFTNDRANARSAGLLAFPTFTLETGRSVATDATDAGRAQPKMLGARHYADPTVEELLYVGPLVYSTLNPTSLLELDPALADRSSLLLSYEEPRAFSPGEEFTATYEGVIRAPTRALIQMDAASGLGLINEGVNAALCGSGVQDVAVTREIGSELGVSAGDLDTFARRHADYVQIVGDFLDEDDEYWRTGAGATCGAALFDDGSMSGARLPGRQLCEQFFGPPEVPSDNRDLRVVEASEDRLVVEPRRFDPRLDSGTRRRNLLEFTACCFSGPTDYQARAGHQWVVRGSSTGFAHRITTDPATRRCVQDCNPLSSLVSGRAFEISCGEECTTDALNRPPIGRAVPGEDFACVVPDGAQGGISPGEPGAECVFQNLTSRFAIYRGLSPSLRDMRFRWQFGEGYGPLGVSLISTERRDSTPRTMSLVPRVNQFVITDGSARGLTFLSPRNPTSITSIF